MLGLRLVSDLRSYYRGSRNRDPAEFYDLESSLPYFDNVGRILCAHKRRILVRWIERERFRGPILELGGGIGTFARDLGRRGYQVVSIDVSPAKTKKARQLTAKKFPEDPERVRHISGDLRELSNGSGFGEALRRELGLDRLEFDVVVAADVLEHLPDTPDDTMATVSPLVSKTGRLFASVPSVFCLNDPGHLWKLLPEDWEMTFADAGFQIDGRKMSRVCWYGLPTPLPLAMVYELRASGRCPQKNTER